MATKDLFNPAVTHARTPKGREVAVDKMLSKEGLAIVLEGMDEMIDNDPEFQARVKRNSKRRERWEFQQQPYRAWRVEEQRLLSLEGEEALSPEALLKARREFLKNFVYEREKHLAPEFAGQFDKIKANIASRRAMLSE